MSKQNRIRLGLIVLYGGVCYGMLFWYSYGNPFCSRPGSAGHAVTSAWLASACTAWDALVVFCGARFASSESGVRRRFFVPLVTATITGVVFGSMPFWMYEGYGSFLWPDVSCFFTEGYALAFPFVIAPPLALATLLHCWLVIRFAPRVPKPKDSANGWWPTRRET